MELDKNCLVYLMKSPSDKLYVGITTKKLDKRISEHNKIAYSNKGYALHKAIRKYGIESFIITQIDSGTLEECRKKERDFISLLNSQQPNGYNITGGGEGRFNVVFSYETKEKIRNANLGKKQSIETIEKRRISTTGLKRSDKFKEELSKRKLGVKASKETLLKQSEASKKRADNPKEKERLKLIGTNHSKEILDKISKALTGRVIPLEVRLKMSKSQKQRLALKKMESCYGA